MTDTSWWKCGFASELRSVRAEVGLGQGHLRRLQGAAKELRLWEGTCPTARRRDGIRLPGSQLSSPACFHTDYDGEKETSQGQSHPPRGKTPCNLQSR